MAYRRTGADSTSGKVGKGTRASTRNGNSGAMTSGKRYRDGTQKTARTTREFFDHEDYSDITLKLDGRTFPAHRIIICEASDHFRAMCGPGSRFKESSSTTITLHEDDAAAFHAMLSHMYRGTYVVPDSFMKNVEDEASFYTSVLAVADKYIANAEFEAALTNLRDLTGSNRVQDSNTAMALLEVLGAPNSPPRARDVLQDLMRDLLRRFNPALIEMPNFLRWLGDQPAIHKDVLSAGFLMLGKIRHTAVQCPQCRSLLVSQDETYPDRQCCPRPGCYASINPESHTTEYWL